MRLPTFCLLANAILLGTLSAQAGEYTVFSHGCPGTGPNPIRCGSRNGAGGTSTLKSLPNEYCYHHKATTAITVVGIQLYTKTFATNSEQVIGIGLYRNLAGAPRQSFAASGTMLVKNTAGFYTGYFARPVKIAKDEEFWISQFDTRLVRAAGLSTGTAASGPTFWRPAAGGTGPWSSTSIVKNPSYHILCEGTSGTGTAVPNLTHTGLPAVGKDFFVNLHHAPARPAVLLAGAPQNIPLRIFGAPGCRLLTTLDFVLPAGVPKNGALSFRIPIPNWPILKGFTFVNQFYISEPTVNGMGLTTTNGGLGKIGG